MSWLRKIIGAPANTSSDLEKSHKGKTPQPKSWQINPEDINYSVQPGSPGSQVLTETHPGTMGMDYSALMAVSRVPVIGAIIQTRIQQVAEFCVPQPDRYSVGYRIRLRDPKKKMTRAAEREAHDISRMIEEAGGHFGYGAFEPTMRALMRDSLVYDQCNFEVIRERGGKVWGFVPVDAMTIRRAVLNDKEKAQGRIDFDHPRYVQVVNNKVQNEYKLDEMAWGVRRPRTWLGASGYGYPEIEELVRVITDLLNAQTWNSVNFTNGINTSTILALKSSMTADVFRAFQRHVTSMMAGVRNRSRIPIVQLNPDLNEDIRTVDLSQSAKDMEYMQWIGFLVKIVCAVYLMDPAELGFVFGTEGQSNSLVAQGPTERIIASKERGLRPLLRAVESWMNRYVIYAYNDDFSLDFVGLDTMTEEKRTQLDLTSLRGFRTVNEVRTEHDLPKLDSPVADMILDPTYIQQVTALLQQEQQEEMGGMPGAEPGQEEGGGLPEGMDEAQEGDTYADYPGMGEPMFGNNIDEVTQAAAGATEKAIKDGRISVEGTLTGKRKTVFTKAGVRAYIIEVD